MPDWLIPYTLSNAVGLLLLAGSFSRPNLVRGVLGVGFVGACAANLNLALSDAHAYTVYATYAWPGYREFINGPFAQNPALFVVPIAVGQLAVGLAALTRGAMAKLGLAGMIVFLLAIAPLGYYSGFPFSLVVGAGLVVLLRREYPTSIPAVVKQLLWELRGRWPSMRSS